LPALPSGGFFLSKPPEVVPSGAEAARFAVEIGLARILLARAPLPDALFSPQFSCYGAGWSEAIAASACRISRGLLRICGEFREGFPKNFAIN